MMGTETPTVITSLTSNRTGGQRKNNTTSLAEALATTVADYMCEGGGNAGTALRKNGEILNNPLNSPSSAMAPLNSNLPNDKSKGRNMAPPPARSASTTGISENNKSQINNGSSATSTITTPSNGSSMGSTIEDLASVCNFRQQTSSSSAPIISGTAAEVLALQNAIREYSTTTNTSGAVVSNPSSVESPTISPLAPTSSNTSLARNTSDGAPMISGTAAAQMAMIATAAKITENGGHTAAGMIVNNNKSHDASHHGFQNGSGLDVDAVASLKVGHHDSIRQISPEDLSSSSLTSTTIGNASSAGSSSCNPWNQTRPLHIKSANNTGGGAGGMDILAEITCHAPPMPLFHQQQYQQTPVVSTNSTSSYQQMYHQVKHRVSGIPSYQEIYREMGQQQHQQQAPATSAFHQHHGYRVESVDDISNNTSQTHSTNIRFGHPPSRDMLEEGKEIYTRKDLVTYGGHLCENKDVHGNMKDGCDSIVLANLEKDIREGDGLIWFLFSSDRANGGGALCKSFHRKLPIRVFRSSIVSGRYAPPYLDDEENEEDDEIAYRYDGLYTIDAVWDVHGQETETFPCLGVEGWQTYFFTRVPKRPLEKEKHVAGMQYNKLGMQELWGEVQKMRGVRRPKKFEIPMAPIKLSAIKRAAITGQNASRKVGAYHPPSLEELQKKQREEEIRQQAKLLKRQQSSTSSKSGTSGNKRLHDNSHSSEEEDDDESVRNDSGEEETKHRSYSPISRKSSSSDKLVTPRPRLNSSASPRSKGNANYDSSDSDSSAKGRRSPTKLSSPKLSSSNAVDSSLFFPKRASAAKAENANREMFGKKKRPYNRRSPTKGGRKRKKAEESDSDDEDDESSEEGGLVDQAVLTVGSRVLVQYKGSLFKATIRKRREKNDKHSFLIHYDGNKKTNVHWIPLERITEILFINLDAPPQPETTRRGGAVKRKTKKAKRPAVRRQKQKHSHSDSEDEAIAEESSVPQKLDVKESIDEKDNDINKTESNEGPQSDETAAAAVVVNTENQSDDKKDDLDSEDPHHAAEDDGSLAATKQEIRETVVLDLERASSLNNAPENDEESVADASQIEHESTSSTAAKQKKVSGSTEEFKHPIGGRVYVEYGRSKIFYHSTIVNARKKRSVCEYLVHYDGYKKSANRWVKESALHEVNSDTTRRFEDQRNVSNEKVPNEILYKDQPAERFTRGGRKAGAQDKQPPRAKRMRSDVSELSNESVLGNIEPGVAFLQGSVVFADWKGVLYLAKMLKKRYSGDRTEYLLSYDGYSSKYDAWVSIHKIYEINPQTKRAFKKLKAGQDPPGGRRKGKRKQEEDDDSDEDDEYSVESAPKKRVYRKKSTEESTTASSPTRRGSRKRKDDSSEVTARSSTRSSKASTTLDMQGIEAGVDFLPGSTIFAEYKGGLCLAKMIKKRGKGDYTEYYIQYMGLKKTEETWMSVGLLYEINPQTKRMFRLYSKKA